MTIRSDVTVTQSSTTETVTTTVSPKATTDVSRVATKDVGNARYGAGAMYY